MMKIKQTNYDSVTMQNKETEEVKYRLKFHSLYAGMPNDCCIVNRKDVTKSLQYIDQLENKVKELGKGQHKLMQSRRKWKNRYYKERQKNRKYLKNL